MNEFRIEFPTHLAVDCWKTLCNDRWRVVLFVANYLGLNMSINTFTSSTTQILVAIWPRKLFNENCLHKNYEFIIDSPHTWLFETTKRLTHMQQSKSARDGAEMLCNSAAMGQV